VLTTALCRWEKMMTPDDDRPFWDPDVQTMPRDALRALQDERVREAVGRAYEGADFFRRRFDEAGVRPDDVKSVDDLDAIPAFTKADLRENEAAVPPIGDYRVGGLSTAIRLATSSGTTGRPTFTLWTKHDLELDYDLAARRYWRSGVRPGSIIVNAHPGFLNGGQAIVAGAAEYMGCLPVSIGLPSDDESVERALRTIEDLPIAHWHLMPAAASRIRDVAIRIGWKGKLPELELTSPARQFGVISAGQECVGTLGSTCDVVAMKGAHLAEDAAIVEVLDPVTRQPVADGERGVLVCTSLGRDNPMIRYDLEDIIRIVSDPCSCGETHRRAFWDGRARDAVEIEGRWIMPIDVWQELPLNREFMLVRHSLRKDRLDVRLEGNVPSDLVERIEARTGVPVDVTSVTEGTFPRAEYKSDRVTDEE
jgi:phenylacetate-CoA ligase